jgi:predicted MFS family arabinose efflux permease
MAPNVYWLVPIEVLDGLAAGLVSVAMPVAIADLTYGTGRTQTAIGGTAMLQGIGGAMSSTFGGMLATHFGWAVAFLGLSVPSLGALALLLSPLAQRRAGAGRVSSSPPKAAASSVRV